jgi:hypothetical protein
VRRTQFFRQLVGHRTGSRAVAAVADVAAAACAAPGQQSRAHLLDRLAVRVAYRDQHALEDEEGDRSRHDLLQPYRLAVLLRGLQRRCLARCELAEHEHLVVLRAVEERRVLQVGGVLQMQVEDARAGQSLHRGSECLRIGLHLLVQAVEPQEAGGRQCLGRTVHRSAGFLPHMDDLHG